MYEDINELIDINLKLVCESKDSEFCVYHFVNSNGTKINLLTPAKRLAAKMEAQGLISVQGDFVNIEDFGWEVYKNGGWKRHLAKLDEQSRQKGLYEEKREQLEFEKSETELELTKRMLKEYPKTKWFARIAFIIALLLFLKDVILFLIPIFK